MNKKIIPIIISGLTLSSLVVLPLIDRQGRGVFC